MRRVQKWLLALLLLIGAGAAVLAAVATSQVAVETGVVTTPALGLIFPLIVEGSAILAVVLAWQRTAAGLSAWAEYVAFLVLLTLAGAVNLTHAGYGPEWLSAVVPPVLAASPPVILAGCVEMLLRSLRALRSAERSADLSAPLNGDPSERASALASSAGERSVQVDALLVSAGSERSGQGGTPRASGAGQRSPGAPLSARPVDTERPMSAPADIERASAKRLSAERPKVAAASAPRPSSATKKIATADASAPDWEDLSRDGKVAYVRTLLVEQPNMTGPDLVKITGAGDSTARNYLSLARAA